MSDPTVVPYGTWISSVSADLIAAGGTRLGHIQADGGDLYWTEGRPAEAGRVVVVRRAADGTIADVNPPPFNARSRVHEYGGGAYLAHGGTLFFASFADNRLYRQDPGGAPQPITPPLDARYADMVFDTQRNALICVCENHAAEGEPSNFIASIPALGGHPTPLVTGRDFVMAPRLSPDGTQLAWLAWDHPNMPWDAAELWLADVSPDGLLRNQRMIAGGLGDSCCQPEWSPDGTLYVVAERTGWWNLYRVSGDTLDPLCPLEAEFSVPQWVFGITTYAIAADGSIFCTYGSNGVWQLARLDPATKTLTTIPTPFRRVDSLRVAGDRLACIGSSVAEPPAVALIDLATGAAERVRRASEIALDPQLIAIARPVTFPSAGGNSAYGFFYPPTNPAFRAPPGELPPLIVMSHGGPTGDARDTFSLGVQYWTSRGFAVLDVNYRGSTGFGRVYREQLDGQWGIADVDDCCAGALWLAAERLVDRERMAITGGSAGGYTTLACLTFRDVFKAGASHFGIGDLEAMVRDTHKFESRYLDRLVAPYPERRDIYLERSPIHHVSALESPVIFFQGLDDKIVPPNQAEEMVAALRAKGVPVEYVVFEGEGHGFRKAENIRRTLEDELAFYGKVFGFSQG
jgi:dipeptidyl aminopeptidase/acylaminoacyl peptidase